MFFKSSKSPAPTSSNTKPTYYLDATPQKSRTYTHWYCTTCRKFIWKSKTKCDCGRSRDSSDSCDEVYNIQLRLEDGTKVTDKEILKNEEIVNGAKKFGVKGIN